jgi:hypothetical protein
METVDRSPPSPEAIREGHESSNPNVYWIWIFFLVLFAVGVVLYLILTAIMGHFVTVEKRTSVPPPRYSDTSGLFPGPKLQENPNADLQELEREMGRKLGDGGKPGGNPYAWDSRARRGRIPIERAMQLIAERGLPDRESAADRKHGEGK